MTSTSSKSRRLWASRQDSLSLSPNTAHQIMQPLGWPSFRGMRAVRAFSSIQPRTPKDHTFPAQEPCTLAERARRRVSPTVSSGVSLPHTPPPFYTHKPLRQGRRLSNRGTCQPPLRDGSPFRFTQAPSRRNLAATVWLILVSSETLSSVGLAACCSFSRERYRPAETPRGATFKHLLTTFSGIFLADVLEGSSKT